MTNSRANTGGKLQTIENYTSASTMTTKTFTISPAIDWSLVSEVILIIDCSATAALILEMKLNGETSSYYTQGTSMKAGTETLINDSDLGHIIIARADVLAANSTAHIEIHIGCDTEDSKLVCNIQCTGSQTTHEQTGGHLSNAETDLSSIIIEVSTSSLKANHRMTLYKLLR